MTHLFPIALIACAAMAACDEAAKCGPLGGVKDAGPNVSPDAGPDAGSAFGLVPGELRPVVLSVCETPDHSVFIAGGEPTATGGFIARLVGDRFVPEATPPGRPLWWVFSDPSGTVRSVGEEGRVVRRTELGFVDEPTGLDPRAHLWGGFSTSTTESWAVGGSVRRGGPKGLVLRKSGDAPWQVIHDPAFPSDLNFYKVWGDREGTLHFVGEGGLTVRFDGRRFERLLTNTSDLLFTVHGQPRGPILAVGGLASGRVLRYDDGLWVDETPPQAPPLNGVYVREDGRALLGGGNGTLLERSPEGVYQTIRVRGALPFTFHATLFGVDAWAVGGDLSTATQGAIATTRRPAPGIEFSDVSKPDVAPADLEVPDAALSDVVVPDLTIPDRALTDGSQSDGSALDDAPSRDAVHADAPSPQDALPLLADALRVLADGPLIDLPLPLPSHGEPCESSGYLCANNLECWSVFSNIGVPSAPVCMRTCTDPIDCSAAYGESPCCAPPGPQLLDRFCFSRELAGGSCP